MAESPISPRAELAPATPRVEPVFTAWLCTSLEVLGIWYIIEWLHSTVEGAQAVISGDRILIAPVLAVGYLVFTRWLRRVKPRPTV